MTRASNKPFTACEFRHKLKLSSDMSDLLVMCEVTNVLWILTVLSSVFRRMCQCPPPLQFELRVVFYWVYIWLVFCSPRHSGSALWFRHSSRLIQVRTLTVPWRHSPSWIGTHISELDFGRSSSAECSKLYLTIAEFKAERPVDVLHSVCRWKGFSSPDLIILSK